MDEEKDKVTFRDDNNGTRELFKALKLADGEYLIQEWKRTPSSSTIAKKWRFDSEEDCKKWMEDNNLNLYINEAK